MVAEGFLMFPSMCHKEYYLWQSLRSRFQSSAEFPCSLIELIKLALQRIDPFVMREALSKSRGGKAYEGLYHLELWRCGILRLFLFRLPSS